ncbi:LpqN/LpqT family lipoprotein [Rhodococcus sp. BP22]|uniref:LpqN/LpqT family lipoprotein n=1 Tax=Rhodococcus sp. BP22 TaxID=2758566 RepID=UPI0028F6F3C0|nr:LpqN/LpqT family lipoprotein [Rhodococcus sp. BP22]
MEQSSGSNRMTVAQYLAAHAVAVTSVDRAQAATLGIEAPVPAGWQAAPEEQFPGATQVLVEPGLVEGGFAPNAVLLVGSLSTRVDADDLLDCSFTDARAMEGWVETEASSDPFGGHPSRFIRGTFVAEQWELAVTTRYIVVQSETQYLVQLTVTTFADHADKLAFDIDAINSGLLNAV